MTRRIRIARIMRKERKKNCGMHKNCLIKAIICNDIAEVTINAEKSVILMKIIDSCLRDEFNFFTLCLYQRHLPSTDDSVC